MITHRSNLAVPISSILAYNHTQDNHLDSISGIRTRAIEIVNVFEMEFRWEKDIVSNCMSKAFKILTNYCSIYMRVSSSN